MNHSSEPLRFFNNRRTGLVSVQPWGLYRRTGSRVLCSDGKIRSLCYLADTADTFFSVPAAVRIGGRYVHGYVTSMEASPKAQGYKVRRCATIFHPHTGQAANTLPEFPEQFSDAAFELLAVACDTEPNV